ncbi:MAG: type II toxin-antitoxin system PemK/MazF family toxin [Nanoarchaeota archaeon]|nr:type II toxin-antitoxin system PemK/MazF family toxin [Nanoarchaeota archaeon]
MEMVKIKRGDIVIANLSPIKGSEQGGTRPCLIIQNDIGNEYSPTTIIAAITSKKFNNEYPTNVNLSAKDSRLDKDSTILLNQIRTIDKKRIIKKISYLETHVMNKVELAIKISLELD